MNKRSVAYSSVMFYLQFSLEKYPLGKVDRKHIFRGIKKHLAKERVKDTESFIKIASDMHDILHRIKDEMVIGNVDPDNLLYINPAYLLKLFKEDHTDIYNLWGIDEKRLSRYIDTYKDVKLTLPTRMYLNRATKLIDMYLDH